MRWTSASRATCPKLLSMVMVLALLVLLLLAATPAQASELVTLKTPSKHVDPATVVWNGDDHPQELRANVLLPDGYDAKRRYPVLFLLHGVGDAYDTWAKPERGDIEQTAKGFPGIIVMPEGDRGFYTNWWNDGKRGDPGWERYDLEELIPLVERKFRIRKARRWHAIAGLSMGGMGTMYLASQRPHYFGSAASFSGFVSHQSPGVDLGLQLVGGVEYEKIFGPAGRLLRDRPQPVAAHGQPAPHAPVRDGRRRHAGGGPGQPAGGGRRGRTEAAVGRVRRRRRGVRRRRDLRAAERDPRLARVAPRPGQRDRLGLLQAGGGDDPVVGPPDRDDLEPGVGLPVHVLRAARGADPLPRGAAGC